MPSPPSTPSTPSASGASTASPSPAPSPRPTTAGDILRRTRRLTGLSQAALADRLGVQQTLISVYERGARRPTVETLERMVDAAGLRLTWSLAHGGSGGGALAGLTGPIGRRLVERRHEAIDELTKRGFTTPRVIGPVSNGTEVAGEQLFIVVDDNEATITELLSASGMLRLILGQGTSVIHASDAERHGFDRSEVEAAVALDG